MRPAQAKNHPTPSPASPMSPFPRNPVARRALRFLAALILALPVVAQAATLTRTSAFDYSPTTGLLTKEIIEPGDPNLCLVTAYAYDTYGNKASATTRNCNGSTGSVPASNSEAAAPYGDAVIAPRTTSNTYDARGQFPTAGSNALSQSDSPGALGVAGKLGGERINEDKWIALFGDAPKAESPDFMAKLTGTSKRIQADRWGGNQGGPGQLFGFYYPPGGIVDKVVETFAGVHDSLNHPWFYNSNGTSHAFLPQLGVVGDVLDTAVNGTNVLLATPVAGAALVPENPSLNFA